MQAESKEMDNLERLQYAEIVDIPEGAHLLPCIWVYKYKTDEHGNRILYKARVVVRGDYAIKNLEFYETYSPVAKLESVRLVLAMIITHKLIPVHIDIGNAYIWSTIDEPVYLKGIPGQNLSPRKCLKTT
jgi:hypothetical protein